MLLKKRYSNIDLIEFLGMIFVLVYHCTTYSYSFIENNSYLYYLRYYFRTILATCVPLFFFANGYLLFNREFNLKKHIVKSIKIIMVTVIWAIIGVFCIMLIEQEPLTLVEFIKYVVSLHHGWINHLWFMEALIFIYIFFPMLKRMFDSHRKVFVYLTIIMTVFSFGCPTINHFRTILSGGLGSVGMVYSYNVFYKIKLYAFSYFCIGGLMFSLQDPIAYFLTKKRKLCAILVMAICCFVLCFVGVIYSRKMGTIWDVVWNGYDTIPTLLNVLLIFVLSVSYKNNYKIIKYISCNTSGIYFVHPIFIHLLAPLVKTCSFLCTYIGAIFYAVVILLLSLGIICIIKKVPMIKNVMLL